jgi:hypothetical protein
MEAGSSGRDFIRRALIGTADARFDQVVPEMPFSTNPRATILNGQHPPNYSEGIRNCNRRGRDPSPVRRSSCGRIPNYPPTTFEWLRRQMAANPALPGSSSALRL